MIDLKLKVIFNDEHAQIYIGKPKFLEETKIFETPVYMPGFELATIEPKGQIGVGLGGTEINSLKSAIETINGILSPFEKYGGQIFEESSKRNISTTEIIEDFKTELQKLKRQ